MEKKKFKVCVTTTFVKWYEIEAASKEDVGKELLDGDYLDTATDTDDIDTTYDVVEEE